MKVYINKINKDGKIVDRQLVNAELVKETIKTAYKIDKDGNVITRKKKRDLPKEVNNDK